MNYFFLIYFFFADEVKTKQEPLLTNKKFRSHPKGSNVTCTQEHRKARLEEYCEAQRQKGAPLCHPWTVQAGLTGRQLLVDDINKVLYCEVPKSACSSWKSFFLTLTGKVDPEDLRKDYLLAHQSSLYKKIGLKYLHEYTNAQRLYKIQYYFKFLVTRSPYERVTSAYQDKILETTWYQKYVGKWIMRHYRKNPDKFALDTGKNVTFNEFVQFISNPNEFKVFQVHDAHWMSTAALCCPCMYKYDYIGKVETMKQDADYLVKKIIPGWNNVSLTHSHTVQGEKAKTNVQKLLSTLTPKERRGLDRLFEDDFNMFDYSYDENNKPLCGEEDGCC